MERNEDALKQSLNGTNVLKSEIPEEKTQGKSQKTVHMYLENGAKSVHPCRGWYGYVLEYQGIRLHTREHFGQAEGSRQRRDLEMLVDALGHCAPCRIIVHTEEAYLAGGYGRMEHYEECGWVTSTGEPVKYKELWQQVYRETRERPLEFALGEHSYTGWLRNEMKRRKGGEHDV